MVPNMAPSRVMGGLAQSSASSGIFFLGDGQSQNFINSHMSSSFGNSANSIPGTGHPNLGPVSGDINQTVLNSVANSASSIGASSMVTDANSAFSGGPQLQRSASINTESYMRLPASPMSFTSNNISISGSSAIDGSSTVQQNSHQDSISQHLNQSQQHLQHGAMGAASMPASQMGQMPVHMASRIPNTLIQDPSLLSQAQKKPRLDIKQEDFVQQQPVMQQILQRDPMQLQPHNPQLQAFIQQQRIRQQHQQILQQAMPQMQRAQLQQQQLRQIQQQNMQQMTVMKNPQESGGLCARRLMQYLYHQQKPSENTISYWRSFVKEYYAPRAKKRWCLSLYDNVAHQGLGVFPQAAMDAWHCDICGSKSGKGFEAIYEVLPRLNEIKFSSGVIDELLFLDVPRERRSVSGIMMLEYEKAVQETVYEQVRIVREGRLRIIFTQDLKILSWEFCARRHEELLPRRIVTSQVNQLLQVAQKCQSTTNGNGSEGISTQDLQSNSNMMVNAGRQLVKSLELHSLNDLGFSKRYVRCLQIAEVVNSMKDLMAFCRESKVGPIEGLKNYPRHTSSASNLQLQKMQEIEQLARMQGMPTDRNTLNKIMAMQLGINNNNNNPPNMAGSGALSGPSPSGLPLTNCQQSMLTRQSSINSNPGSLHQEASSSLTNPHPSPSPSSSFQGPSPGSNIQGGPIGGFPSPRLGPQHHQQQQQRGGLCVNGARNSGQMLQQQMMMQHLLQDMSNRAVAPPAQPGQQQQQKMLVGGGFGSSVPGGGSSMGGSGPTLNNCNSFKMTTNNSSDPHAAAAAAGGAINGFNTTSMPRVSSGAAGDMSQNLHLADEMVQELTNDITDSGFFNSNLDDALGYSWKS